MITTVHEDDLLAWYRVPDPIANLSIRDFELDDDDLIPEHFGLIQTDNDDESINVLLRALRSS